MEKKQPTRRRTLLGILILFTLFIAIVASCSSGSDQTSTTQSKTVSIGENGVLNANRDSADCEGGTVLGTTKENYEAFIEIQVVDDKLGYLQMLGNEKLFIVDNCIQVKVIDTTFSMREVRILEGDHMGKSGWTVFENITNL